MKSSVLSSRCTLRSMWWRLLLILPLLHALQCHFFSAFCIGTYEAAFFLYAGGDFRNLAVLNRAGTGFWTLGVLTVFLSSGRTSWALFVFFSVSASIWTTFSGFFSSSSGRPFFVSVVFAYLKLSCKRFASAFCDAVEYFLGGPITGGFKSEWWTWRW